MISRVEYNKFTDEYCITIPDDIVEALGLETGDTLLWTLSEDRSSVYLTKKVKNLEI